jgi:hypothetical protein
VYHPPGRRLLLSGVALRQQSRADFEDWFALQLTVDPEELQSNHKPIANQTCKAIAKQLQGNYKPNARFGKARGANSM